MIDIKSISGELLISVPILSDAISHEELMTSDFVQLSWESEKSDILPVGAHIEHNGERYSLLNPYQPSMRDEATFKYAPQFHSRIIRWQKIIVPVYTYSEDGATIKSREFDWNFTGTPADALSMLQRAIYHETGELWDVEMAEGLPATVSLSAQSSSIWSILSDLAEQCDTEWWADKGGNKLYLSRCSYGNPFELEVGKSVKVPSIISNREEYFTRFYAFGSTRNITQDEGVVQGSIVNKRLTLDPKKYPHGYKDIRGHFENDVFVSDLLPEEVMVKSLYFEDIYPSSKLTIEGVRKRMRYRLDNNGDKIRVGGTDEAPVYEQYAIWYFQVPDLEFTEDLIIEGQTLSVAFKSGRLTGREFELAYHSEDKKVADSNDVDENFTVQAGEYEIILDESNGFILPDDDYIIPSNGDEITLFNINMPEEYKASARVELEKELDEAIEEYTRDNNSYEFDSNPIYFHDNVVDMRMGHAVKFINGNSVVDTRVLMVEKHLDYPFEQRIRVGNVKISGQRQQLSEEVRNISEEVERMSVAEERASSMLRDHNRDLMLTTGRYLALKDTLDMLQGAIEGYTEGIDPITVETMAMLVGDESLQFRFTASRESLAPLDKTPIAYNSTSKRMEATPCALVHMALGITDVTAIGARKAADYKSWIMEEWASDTLLDPKKLYYVYAKVEKNGVYGTYALSETPIKMNDDKVHPDFYFFLIGVLNAEYAERREFVTLYGFTEILPSRISTDLISSADGNTYFDLLRGIISGTITFKTNGGEYKPMADFADEQQSSIAEVGKTIQKVQDQIDGVIENWNGYGAPTLENEPYISWTTDADKIAHINDTYINIEAYVDDETTPTAGHAWRWCECADETITDYVTVTDKDGKTYRLHWHEIADSDAVRALKEAAEAARKAEEAQKAADEANEKVSDLEYLSKAFGKGETIVSGGVVMTEMVAVGEDSNEVSAVLNGSGFGSDSTHGKTILAGGIPEGEADNLEERIRQANTRIHEDGTIVSKLVHLKEGCTIGDVRVTQTGVEVDNANIEGKATFNEQGVGITGALASAGYFSGMLGECGHTVLKVHVGDSVYEDNCPMSLDDDNNPIPIGVASSVKRGVAFRSDKGVFEGLRPKVRHLKGSEIVLNQLDHTIISAASSGIKTLWLPSNPEDGQVIKIWKNNAHTLRITSEDRNIVRLQVANAKTHDIDGTFSGHIDLVYSKEEGSWLLLLTKTM